MKRRNFFDFTKDEIKIFTRLNTPKKIQDFLDRLPVNFEENGETYLSPREVMLRKTAHCSEAAIFVENTLTSVNSL